MHIDLSDSAIALLKEAISDPDGNILKTLTFGGSGFTVNGRDLNAEHTPRSTAALEAALHELWNKNLVTRNQAADIYTVTQLGYDYADSLPNNSN